MKCVDFNSTTHHLKYFQVAKVLDSKRSQNVGIFITSQHLDIADVENGEYELYSRLQYLPKTVITNILHKVLFLRESFTNHGPV